MKKKSIKFAVLGGSNAGLALTGRLCAAGYEVNLYEHPKFKHNITPVKEKKGLNMMGAASPKTGFVEIKGMITTNIEKAIKNVDVINVVVPAFAHKVIYDLILPYLEDGQIILIHTGNWGSLVLSTMIKARKIEKAIKIAETAIFLYACRISAPATISIFSHKKKISMAALPSNDTENIINTLKEAFPEFVMAKNVLVTSLSNLNFHHVPLMVLNAGRIESTKGDFLFWKEGSSPAIGNVMASIDEERMAVMNALGLKPTSQLDITNEMYGTSKDSYYKMIQTLPQVNTTKAPSNLLHRYISEDVPFGLVPIASLGDILKISTPTIDALIVLASKLVKIDFIYEGANINRLGLAGLTAREIQAKVS